MQTVVVRRVSIPMDRTGVERPTVLLVTGDANLRAACSRALGAAGYGVVEAAHSGHALLQCLRAPRIDVLVAELAMDGTSGPSLSRLLRRHHPDLLTVYFAQAGTPECDGVLVRPFTRDELIAQVEAAAAARP